MSLSLGIGLGVTRRGCVADIIEAPMTLTDRTLSPGHTPVWREDFADADSRSGDPVTGTFRRVPLGPQLDGGHPTGWAAVQATTSGSYVTSTLAPTDGSATPGRDLIGQWCWVDTDAVPTNTEGATAPQFALVRYMRFGGSGWFDLRVDNSGDLKTNDSQSVAQVVTRACPRRRWFWIGYCGDGVNVWERRCRILFYDPESGNGVETLLDQSTSFDGDVKTVILGVQNLSGSPRQHPVRVGGLARYTRSSFTGSATYPQEWTLPPIKTVLYVNPATGSDSNDGLTPATAWQTAAKITTEMTGGGILPLASSPATGSAGTAGAGTQVVIDTTTAPLVIGDTLDIAASDVWVKPAAGQRYIDCQAEVVLDPAAWSVHSGSVYKQAITTAIPDIHVWDAKVGEAPRLYTRAANVAGVDGPGKWAIVSGELYIRTYDSSNPGSDGVRRVRSRVRGSDNTGPAVAVRGRNQRVSGIRGGFTATSRTPLDDNGAYVLQGTTGIGGRVLIEDLDGRYAGKHVAGITASTTDSVRTWLRCRGEQCWSTATGGATVFVTYMTSAGGTGNTEEWIDCRVDAGTMAANTPEGSIGTASPAYLAHGDGAGTPFTSVTLTRCHFGGNTTEFQGGVVAAAAVTGGSHSLGTYIPVTATGVSLRAAPSIFSGGSVTQSGCTNDY